MHHQDLVELTTTEARLGKKRWLSATRLEMRNLSSNFCRQTRERRLPPGTFHKPTGARLRPAATTNIFFGHPFGSIRWFR